MNREDVERLVRIEEGVNALLGRSKDHERRMRRLEREQWAHRGGLAVVAFVAAKLGLSWTIG
jgi:hypothetical protein